MIESRRRARESWEDGVVSVGVQLKPPHDQNVGSREAEGLMEGAEGPRRGRSKSASPSSCLLRGFRDSNTH